MGDLPVPPVGPSRSPPHLPSSSPVLPQRGCFQVLESSLNLESDRSLNLKQVTSLPSLSILVNKMGIR